MKVNVIITPANSVAKLLLVCDLVTENILLLVYTKLRFSSEAYQI